MSSLNKGYKGWDGNESLTDQLITAGYGDILDECMKYTIYVGKGGEDSNFYHHYIVVKSKKTDYLIFELTGVGAKKTSGAKVVARLKVMKEPGQFEEKEKSLERTLRYLADTASDIIYKLGNYNLISSSCQTFCDEFLKTVTGKGYNTYIKKAVDSLAYGGAVLVIGGVLGANTAVAFCVAASIAIGCAFKLS